MSLDVAEYQLYPVARRAAMLFAATRSLSSLCSELHFSLAFLGRLFDKAFDSVIQSSYQDSIDRSAVSGKWYSVLGMIILCLVHAVELEGLIY